MNVVRLVGGIFAAVGVMLAVATVIVYTNSARFVASAHHAQGVVVELVPSWSSDNGHRSSSPTYASHVRFTTDSGQNLSFVENMSSNPPRHEPGQRVTVLYDPAKPSRARIDDFWGRHGALIIIGPLGMVFTLVGGGITFFTIRAAMRRARVQAHGTRIEADFLHVFLDESEKTNGRHPFRVAVQAKDPRSGRLRRYESDAIWVDPTEQLKTRKVPVLVDRDSDAYWVDLSVLG